MKVGQLGKLLKALKKFDADYAVMAGQITLKAQGLHPDLKAVSLLASLKKNAETIFGAIAKEITNRHNLLDAISWMKTRRAWNNVRKVPQEIPTMARAWHANATQIAALDIGQELVRKGTVLASRHSKVRRNA